MILRESKKMFSAEICLFSPLCIKTAQKGNHPPLLLQFILVELFNLVQISKNSDPFEKILSQNHYFFPYDWSLKIGPLVKIQEHARLLGYAFPKLAKKATNFEKKLKTLVNKIQCVKIDEKQLPENIKTLYELLEPFIVTCNKNENLLLFLLKNNQNIHELAFPDSFETIIKRIDLDKATMIEIVQNKYKNRGFNFTILETKPQNDNEN